jgi:hypothetical protein
MPPHRLRHFLRRTREPRIHGTRLPSSGIAMAFKFIESAQHRWRAVNAPHLVALVRAGARLHNSELIERPEESGGGAQAA